MNQWLRPLPCKCDYRRALDNSHCCTRFSLLRCLFNWKQILHWILPMFSCGSLHLFSSVVWWNLTNALSIILLIFSDLFDSIIINQDNRLLLSLPPGNVSCMLPLISWVSHWTCWLVTSVYSVPLLLQHILLAELINQKNCSCISVRSLHYKSCLES